MIFTLIIAFIGLIGLLVLHEFGHFILAKKFGVKVDEFGIGYPPRLFGKKFGETVYSINLLPFGAFVALPGEVKKVDDPRSFSSQPVWKRALIAFGGVLSFWIISTIIFTVVFTLGTPAEISDEDTKNLIDPKVQIALVSSDSPAGKAGIRIGDAIVKIQNLKSQNQITISKISDLQNFVAENKEEELVLTIQRGKDILDTKIIARASPPNGEGPLGVALVRTAIISFPWYTAPWKAISHTFNLTLAILDGYYNAIMHVFKGEPSGVQLTGPVGVFQMLGQASQLGINYFLNFLALISIYLAIFNILPIPSADGGKLTFLAIEAIRKKPVPEKIEQNITGAFFMALIVLMIFVTIKDIAKLF
ncbi:MAG: hypothetical protein COX90_02875 [Candidatus Nealsonbacteria bacterium CG_4_10_14_0_2_um_filter_38_17]|uniref:PDZ domain-containing protein n=2 Tax=Candidatus Nealsoniibacteriota TaxID=1817911 RepID=A0A2M7UXQ1_9BACT|nr:MAG: hypothetical protein COX36_02995 [Candidatus Nealsonbacteria bacterium CG23_combo_of_CG06-09_8_20_14_all_38_19]PIZ88754.1 MAG: hypothetical protein COX90_02875 [Candidatus Nealsonbacteria bacterium CG_4_10_14_0_2_um_filter_38_17]